MHKRLWLHMAVILVFIALISLNGTVEAGGGSELPDYPQEVLSDTDNNGVETGDEELDNLAAEDGEEAEDMSPMEWLISVYNEIGGDSDYSSLDDHLDDEGEIEVDSHAETVRQETGTALEGRIIALDPGHGGTNPGAVGVTGLRESEVALDVSYRVKNYLEEKGAQVVLSRTADYNVSLSRRVDIAHNAGADIFVSIHANWHPDPSISGTETYYYSRGGNADSSLKLADLIQQELVSDSGLRNIGALHGNFLVIRTPWIPSALIELGFLSNYYDESLLREKSHLDGQAHAISRAINDYFNK